MLRVERSIEILAPIERVFAYVADYRTALRWMHNFTRFEPLPGTPTVGLGAQVAVTGAAFGFPVSTTLEIIEFAPSERLVSRSTGRVRAVSEWSFAPTDQGTRVTFHSSYDLPDIVERLVGREEIQKELLTGADQSLANLKRNIEDARVGDKLVE
jgi:uncharacterized protein YndB with AHSA1/START domain